MNTAPGAPPSTPRSDRPVRVRRTAASLIGATGVFAVLAAVLLARHLEPLPGDTFLARFAVGHRPHPVTTAFQAVTATGTGLTPYLLAAGAGLLLAGRAAFLPHRRPVFRTAATVAACAGWLALGQAARFGLMTAVARPRPPEADWITHASGYAFPSGHTTTSAMAAGLVVAALVVRRPPGRRLWTTLMICWAVLVGASRVWLGVHWATDVLAGWALAFAWTALGALVVKGMTNRPGEAG